MTSDDIGIVLIADTKLHRRRTIGKDLTAHFKQIVSGFSNHYVVLHRNQEMKIFDGFASRN